MSEGRSQKQTPSTLRAGECASGEGLGAPAAHLSIKNTGSEIILLIDILSSSARVSWKPGRASCGGEVHISRASPQNSNPYFQGQKGTGDGNQPAGLRHEHTEGRRRAAGGPHHGYNVCVVGDRASGHRGSLAEGLRLLLGLSQHVPTLRVPLPQVLQLGSHLQVLLGPRRTRPAHPAHPLPSVPGSLG